MMITSSCVSESVRECEREKRRGEIARDDGGGGGGLKDERSNKRLVSASLK